MFHSKKGEKLILEGQQSEETATLTYRLVSQVRRTAFVICSQSFFRSELFPVAQLVEHRAAMREVVSSTPAGPTLRVFK